MHQKIIHILHDNGKEGQGKTLSENARAVYLKVAFLILQVAMWGFCIELGVYMIKRDCKGKGGGGVF